MFEIPLQLRDRICSAEAAAALIPEGAIVAVSGYSAVGDPKTTLLALAKRGQCGDIHSIDLITAAQLSDRVEQALADSGILRRRAPFTANSAISRRANAQELHYIEVPLGKMTRLFADGAFGVPDVAVVEALDVQSNGGLILTTSVGMTSLLCQKARHIILELNVSQPEELIGLHDILDSRASLQQVNQRIGSTVVSVDPDKIVAIVRSEYPDEEASTNATSDTEIAICHNLQNFLEVTFPGTILPPLQSGIGSLAHAIVNSFFNSRFQNLEFFCGALQKGMLDLLAQGRAIHLSGGSLPGTSGLPCILKSIGSSLHEQVVLRSMAVCNGGASAAGLGIIALNTGIEADLYGNVNVSHVQGSRVVNGIGGSSAFASNAALSIVLMPSVRKQGAVSCFVPQTTHVDVVHHDVDIMISEFGVADLRGKDDVERAGLILSNCVHPFYRDVLAAEFSRALAGGGHHPFQLDGPFILHERLRNKGTMGEIST